MQDLSPQTVEALKTVAVESATLINAEHAAILDDCKASQERAACARDRAVKIGTELGRVKEAVGHGKFMGWVQVNCSFSHKTATQYMRFANWNHDSNLDEGLTLREAMIQLDIIPHRSREGGGIFRGSHIPSVYDPLNALTRFLGAVDGTDAVPDWMVEGEERRAVQQQYAPKLQDLILRLFGVRVELPTLVD